MFYKKFFLPRLNQIPIIIILVVLALSLVGCQGETIVSNSDYLNDHLLVDVEWLTVEMAREHLNDPNVVIIKANSPQEYTGEVKLASRGGHIPRAVNMVWLDTLTGGDPVYAIDEDNGQAKLKDEDVEQLKPVGEIEQQLVDLDVTPPKEIITYRQTLGWEDASVYFLLRLMGFDEVYGYPEVTGPEPGVKSGAS